MKGLILTPLFVLIFAGFSFGQATVANCPTITIEGPSGITPIGGKMRFTANVNAVNPNVTYNWSAEGGTNTDGQGSKTIMVSDAYRGSTVTVTVEIGGFQDGCSSTATESAAIDSGPEFGLPFAEWGEMKPNEIRGLLDIYFVSLSNNPKDNGLVLFYAEEKEILEPNHKRIQFLVKHAKFRKFDLNRLIFRVTRADQNRTTLNRYQPGVELPCPECTEYLGSSL